jgi:hypothetical protein
MSDLSPYQEFLAHADAELEGDCCPVCLYKFCRCGEQFPVSTGDGEKASGAAALASSAVRESVPNRMKGRQ